MAAQQGATPQHQRLRGFVGTWRTRGEVKGASSETTATFQATDTYEWLAGGYFLVHRWDADMPDGNTRGIEILGYDAANATYRMQSFDSQGGMNVMHATVDGDRWTFMGDGVRFTGGFEEHGEVFAGDWELRSEDGMGWRPWMKVRLTRVG